MELNGLPVHPLIVHLAVVLVPAAAVLAALYGTVPGWRWALRWPTVWVSLGAVVSVAYAWVSGRDLLDRKPELEPIIQPHQERADILFWCAIVFFVVVVLSAFWMGGPSGLVSGKGERRRRPPVIELSLAAMLVIFAIVLITMTFATGEQGARLVWG
ncbi:DUF2231 domain-containing protein [Nocardioides sp. AE5]|uniref:DUF2231 domain-containing protein n=1 Tax=Nocardioides sp. AE5 TaxID=2962573 RepID=UPI0028820CD3|nr:DUF2231 domain-containing protein [Nocardioides sp. AE5]MDT0200946.1 hypothetical protein [Nocardioides sp. AE5]